MVILSSYVRTFYAWLDIPGITRSDMSFTDWLYENGAVVVYIETASGGLREIQFHSDEDATIFLLKYKPYLRNVVITNTG